MNLNNLIAQCEECIAEVKHTRAALGENTSISLLLLPLLYKRCIADNPRIKNKKLLTFGGMYFTSQYPSLRPYFLSKESRLQLEEIKDHFAKVLEGP